MIPRISGYDEEGGDELFCSALTRLCSETFPVHLCQNILKHQTSFSLPLFSLHFCLEMKNLERISNWMKNIFNSVSNGSVLFWTVMDGPLHWPGLGSVHFGFSWCSQNLHHFHPQHPPHLHPRHPYPLHYQTEKWGQRQTVLLSNGHVMGMESLSGDQTVLDNLNIISKCLYIAGKWCWCW